MFEVIISSVKSGRVWRKVFETSAGADRHVEHFLYEGPKGRNPRDYRVEVHFRPLPALRPIVVPAALEEAA